MSRNSRLAEIEVELSSHTIENCPACADAHEDEPGSLCEEGEELLASYNAGIGD